MTSPDELAEVTADAKAIFVGARALADTRREQVLVEPTPSDDDDEEEPGSSDDEDEEEEPWCEWWCRNRSAAREDYDKPDGCPACGSGDLAITFHPETLDAASVLAALDPSPLVGSSPLTVLVALLVQTTSRRAPSGLAQSALVAPAPALPVAPTTHLCPVCRTQFPPCGAPCCPTGAPRQATRTIPGRAIEPAYSSRPRNGVGSRTGGLPGAVRCARSGGRCQLSTDCVLVGRLSEVT